MTPLDPRQLTLLRIRTAIAGLILLAPIAIAELRLAEEGLPSGWIAGAAAALILLALLVMPGRRYRSWGYRMEEDELVVKHGQLIREQTIVPFGRVQHIDVAQGPIQRALGLATLVLNTAGTRGAAVRLPGLAQPRAEEMRDHIRAKIRQDLA